MNKSIMILAGNFPPYDGGRIGASIRVFTMSEFLAKNGYNVHVVIPARFAKNRDVPEYHENITIHKYYSPFQFYDHAINLSVFHWLSKKIVTIIKKSTGLFFVNAAELYLPLIVLYCIKIINRYSIATVISSSPPQYVMQLALCLKKQFDEQLFWLSDLRDITFIHPTGKKKNNFLRERQKKTETNLIGYSDAFTVVSIGMKGSIKLLFEDKYEMGQYDDKCIIVENGYADVELIEPQFEIKQFAKAAHDDKRIIILYAGTGTLNTSESNAGSNKTLNCFMDVLSNDPVISEKYALIVQGVIKNSENYFNNLKTKLKYIILPPVQNDLMRANMSLADIGININVDTDYAPLIIGGKVYDYCVSGLALFLIFPENAYSLKDFAQKHNNKPYFADVFDQESIRKVLSDIADNPDELKRRRFTKEEMKPHSRESQYKKILGILNQ